MDSFYFGLENTTPCMEVFNCDNATLLLMNGIDLKILSAHLGHNDITTTANVYVDVLKSQQQVVAELIEFNLES